MAASNMLRLTQCLSTLKIQTTPSFAQRHISNKQLLEKLGLPEKPKRPLTPFFIFRNSVSEELLKKNQKYNVLDITKVAASRWKNLNEFEKNKLNEIYRVNYEEYKAKMLEYDNLLTKDQKREIKEAVADIKALKEERLIKLIRDKKIKALNKPKKPLSPFFRYLATQKRGKAEGICDFSKRIALAWVGLSNLDKKKYVSDYNQDHEKYKKDLEDWESNMIKNGNLDVVRSSTLKQKLKSYS